MTLEPLEGFQHFTTHHCVTGSMRHVYVYNDHDVSEELLLGRSIRLDRDAGSGIELQAFGLVRDACNKIIDACWVVEFVGEEFFGAGVKALLGQRPDYLFLLGSINAAIGSGGGYHATNVCDGGGIAHFIGFKAGAGGGGFRFNRAGRQRAALAVILIGAL